MATALCTLECALADGITFSSMGVHVVYHVMTITTVLLFVHI